MTEAKAESKLANLRFWRWKFWKDSKWQITSVMSALFWLFGTLLIYRGAKHYGHGVLVIIAVGFAMDMAAWGIGRALIWSGRKVRTEVSAGRNVVVWLFFFLINGGLTLALAHKGASTMEIRAIMIAYGVLINPVRFRINNEIVFGSATLHEAALSVPRRIGF